MRLPLLVLLAACGGKDSDIFPVDTGAAPATTAPTGGTGSGTGTGGTDPDDTADTGGDGPVVSFDGPARSLVLTELCDDDLVLGLSWFELYNAGEAAVDVGDWRVQLYADGGTSPSTVALPHRALPPGRTWVVVQSGYEALYRDTWTIDADQVALPFELNGDDTVLLFDGEELVDAYGVIGEGAEGAWAYANRTATRFDGVVDGAPRWLDAEWELSFGAAFATPGRHPASSPLPPDPGTATTGGAGAMLISEVVDYADDTRVKYVELYNAGAIEVDLSDWTLQLYENGSGSPQSVVLGGRLAPGQAYVVASADGADGFRAEFGIDADLYSSIAFGNGNDAVQLVGPFGQVDLYGVIGVDGLGSDWDYTDAVVERVPGVYAASGSWDPAQWFRSVGAGAASPGAHGSGGTVAPGELLISELVDHIDDGAVRWIELYNPGPDPASLGRFVLHRYANASPLSATVALSGTLSAGETHVVAFDTGAFNSRYGFAPDQADLVIDGDGNDVYELQRDGVVVDVYGQVGVDGFGTAWDYTDSVVRRDPIVTRPQSTWLAEEWRVTAGAGMESPGER